MRYARVKGDYLKKTAKRSVDPFMNFLSGQKCSILA